MTENRLGRETSPYLLQHRDNPVHWWAWGPGALAHAKAADKPILLSVGYAACHWCHVMAHESFEDDATAAVMNELFVNIKVDREERPDIDAIYMGALHRLGEQGGWPLTMFLDPEARPFWGGTYFPKTSQWGRPAFADVLRTVARLYREKAPIVGNNTTLLMKMLAERSEAPGLAITEALLSDLTARMARAVDPIRGGIQGAPKFPQWSFFWLLWRGAIRYGHESAKQAVVTTLENICQGGIYDHLGGGFSRYSVDERWLTPHFEKMLYDNALLIDLLTEVWRETQNPLFRDRVRETVGWLAREMTTDGGAFSASLDADSEGEEGKFYVWSAAEIRDVLGEEDAAFFGAIYDVTPGGNWEGHTILNRLSSPQPPDKTSSPLVAPHQTSVPSPPAGEGQGGGEPQTSDVGLPPNPSPQGGGESQPHASRFGDSDARLAACRAKLLARRDSRIRPGLDDKVLADWNGLMIAALARASQVFDRPDWLAAAGTAFRFIVERITENGRLRHAFRAGQAKAPAVASDYANMIHAALRLYQATMNDRYLAQAETWAEILERHYWNEDTSVTKTEVIKTETLKTGAYATTADDTTDVIVRLTPGTDDAVPNANAIMVSNLVSLSVLTGKGHYAGKADAILTTFAGSIRQNPLAYCGLLANALDTMAPQQVVIAVPEVIASMMAPSKSERQALEGDKNLKLADDNPQISDFQSQGTEGQPEMFHVKHPLIEALYGVSLPGALEFIVSRSSEESYHQAPSDPPLFLGKTLVAGQAAAYVCLGPQCSAPVVSEDLRILLLRNRRAHLMLDPGIFPT